MHEKNVLWKTIAIVVPVALAAYFLLWDRNFKLGIDLAGGYSLLYEIDDTGLSRQERSDLPQRVIEVLQRRVDPNRVRNLVWRPIGNNRLEIQMPNPPRNQKEMRQRYNEALNGVLAANLDRREIEEYVTLDAAQRAGRLTLLLRGVSDRQALLETVEQQYDAWQAARGANTANVNPRAARLSYEQAVQAVLDTNIGQATLESILELAADSDDREVELKRLTDANPGREGVIKVLVTASDAYATVKGALADPSDLQRLLRGAGVLEFRILPKKDLANPVAFDAEKTRLEEQGPRRYRSADYTWLPIEKPQDFLRLDAAELEDEASVVARSDLVLKKHAGRWYVLGWDRNDPDNRRRMTAEDDWSLKQARPDRDFNTGRPSVSFRLNARGGSLFQDMTSANIKEQLCVVLDGTAISHATIISKIRERGQITGDFTTERVRYMANTFQAGSLPARLKETPLMIKAIGPSLGETNRAKGLMAAVIGLIAIAVVMAGYYLFAGLVANLAVALNLILVLGVMSALQATFTLPGIAGLILTVGMAVDANVLIFERIREELNRGASLRMALRIGYDKAFSTILDANLTTLITCVILGYVGSEEIKGFALTLGFGIVTSMYTALFVTRFIFTMLVSKGLLKTLPMLHIIRVPNIDWLRKKRIFWPVSAVLASLGLAMAVFQPAKYQFDIEFLGGTSAQIEFRSGVKISDVDVRTRITDSGVGWLTEAADRLELATVEATDEDRFTIHCPGVTAEQLEALMLSVFEDKIEQGGINAAQGTATLRTRTVDQLDDDGELIGETHVTQEEVEAALVRAARYARDAARNLGAVRVQKVTALDVADSDARLAFEVVTTETSKRLVVATLVHTFGADLEVQSALPFRLHTIPEQDPPGAFPILDDMTYLQDVIENVTALFDITRFRGGVAMVFELTDQPQTEEDILLRIESMRLQPDYEEFDQRTTEVFPLVTAGMNSEGELQLSKFAVAVVDENFLLADDPDEWAANVAGPELTLVQAALSSEQSLRKVSQFAPQVASQATNQAVMSILLALAAIVAYIWIRFGSMQYGLAAIVALVHDVSVTLGLVTATYYISRVPMMQQVFGINDMKIDLAMVAAFLTIIGYSLNDTIVVFDRIRENRGKLATLSPAILNSAINQCLSRTIMTSLTTLLVVTIMYVVGGPGVHGFSFALIIGVIVGTYSSIGLAAPLLAEPRALRVVIIVLGALAVVGLAFLVDSFLFRAIVGGAAGVAGLVLVVREMSRWKTPLSVGARA